MGISDEKEREEVVVQALFYFDFVGVLLRKTVEPTVETEIAFLTSSMFSLYS